MLARIDELEKEVDRLKPCDVEQFQGNDGPWREGITKAAQEARAARADAVVDGPEPTPTMPSPIRMTGPDRGRMDD